MQIEHELRKNEEGEETADEKAGGPRANEYRRHPLYYRLQSYSRDLTDYILEQRAIQDERQQQMLNFTRHGFQFDMNKPMVPKIMMIATKPK